MASAQSFVAGSSSLEAAYERVHAVILDAEEKRLARSRDVRGPLEELVATLEAKAMQAFTDAQTAYFAGEHAQALARFEALARLNGLRAAREAEGELRKEDDRIAWRGLRDSVTGQVQSADFVAAQTTLRDLERLARRTGYADATEDLLDGFAQNIQTHIDQAREHLEAERYDSAYGPLFEVSRLTTLRAQAVEARRLLGEYANEPGMRQAEVEYEASAALAEIRDDLARAQDHRNADALRQQAQRKLPQLVSKFEGTRAAEQAQQLAQQLSDQLAAG